MTIDPLILAFLIEILILAVAVLLAVLWNWHKQQRRDHKAASGVINRLKQAVSGQADDLIAVLDEIASLAEEERTTLAETILAREKALYRQILQLFLERDSHSLLQVEKQISALTEPYRDLLRKLSGEAPAQAGGELRLARERIRRLEGEIGELAKQLQIATETIESLSSEYTRMFAPDRTSEELESSRKRILAILQANQQRLQGSRPDFDDEDIIIVEGAS